MKKLVLALIAMGMMSGCATIVGEKTQRIQINSNLFGAEFSVKDEKGSIIAQEKTPQGITLEKSEGRSFGKKVMKVP